MLVSNLSNSACGSRSMPTAFVLTSAWAGQCHAAHLEARFIRKMAKWLPLDSQVKRRLRLGAMCSCGVDKLRLPGCCSKSQISSLKRRGTMRTSHKQSWVYTPLPFSCGKHTEVAFVVLKYSTCKYAGLEIVGLSDSKNLTTGFLMPVDTFNCPAPAPKVQIILG